MEWIKKNAVTVIIILLSASFSVATAYQILIGDIRTINIYGQETRTIIVKHLEDVKDSPISEAELALRVLNNSDDIKDHDAKIADNHSKVLTNSTMVGIMREDQKIIKSDIKEILKILNKGE